MFLVRGIILHFLDFIEFLRSEEDIYEIEGGIFKGREVREWCRMG
jgi:hypothetical protein